MFSFVGKIIGNNGAKFLADFFAVIFGSVGHTVKNFLLNIFYKFWNLLTTWIWTICKFVLGFLDAMQLAFTRILGLNINDGTTLSIGDYVEGMKDITISGGSNYYDYIMKIFRAVFGVSILLMIVFTVVAMIIQEYNLAVNGYQKADNGKGKFFKVLLSNIVSIFLIPLIFYTIIVGTNSILTSFYRALGGYSDTTIAGNVLASATYDANRYRAYANANKRIPITISVYEMDNAFGKAKGDEELKSEIQSDEVQEKLRAIAGAFVDNNFLPFEKSTMYKNGTWANYKDYSITYNNTVYDDMGQYFENFICTREQYYVLADFIDYCQLYNIKYYIKAISEDDICWKYVDDLELDVEVDEDGNAIGDLTLDVVYRDAEVVNNPSEVVASATGTTTNSIYQTLQLTTKLDMTSPIADALKTASTLLGIDEEDSSFSVMERDDSGDYTNLVEWSNRKVKLQLSSGFDLTDPSSWTFADQIIVYEYYRFENDYASTNNTLEDYTITQLKDDGAYLDALEMTFRNYNSNTETYSEEHTQYCVKLNGNYYRIKESDSEFDDYGHAYFKLTAVDEEIDYFENQRISIKKEGSKEIKLSDDFDINNKDEWEFTDQLLIYEYFKDLSLSNGLRRTYKFTDFAYRSATETKFNYYKISQIDDSTDETSSEKYYLYINGTYYECDDDGNLETGAGNFLMETAKAGTRWFGYKLSNLVKKNYGIDVLENYTSFVKETISTETVVDDSNAMYQKYSKMNMKLSEGFSFYNTDTWTFRDYAIMYIYINTLSVDDTITIESLKLEGIVGDIVVDGSIYYLKVAFKNGGGTDCIRYIYLDSFDKISEQKITSSISSTQFDDLNLGATSLNFVHYFSTTEDVLLNEEVSSKFFEMSENFDAYDPTTWSIGDYLLLYLVEQDIIDTTIEILKIKGYSALCYATDEGNFYRFGKANNGYFLNEKKINAIGYTVEKWFKTNFMSFLLSARYGNLGNSDLFIEADKFADGTITNAETFLYNITEDFSDDYSLQYILAKDYLSSVDVIKDITEIQYSYSNPTLDESNPSTWKYLDTIIYVLTGSLPTKDNPYVSYLYSNSSDVYLKVGEKYVKINDSSSDTACLMDGTTLLTNQIYSDNRSTFENATKFDEYYKARLKGMLVDNSSLTGTSKFYYYSKDLQGDVTASVQSNKLMSDFDFILAKHGVTLKPDGIYTFDATSVDGEVYVKITGSTWMKITSNDSALIHYKANSLLSNKAYAFTSAGEYTAFEQVSGVLKYTQYDAILYSVYGSAPLNQKFNKYECQIDSNTYLNVNGKFVLYDNSLDTTPLDLNNTTLSDDEAKFLYENYYNQFVVTSIPSAKAQYNLASITTVLNGVSFTCSKVGEYDGFVIICEYFGLNSMSEFFLIETNDGTYYLRFSSASGTRYINLSSLLKVSISTTSSGTTINFSLADNNKETFRWKYRLINTSGSPFTFRSASLLRGVDISNSSWSQHIKTHNNVVDDSSARNNIKVIASNNFDNWQWLGLISSYVDALDAYSVNKYYHNGKVYYHFKNASSDYIVPYEYRSGAFNLDANIIDNAYSSESHPVTSNSALDATIKTLGVSSTGVIRYLSVVGEVKTFFLVTKTTGASTSFHAIYGLENPDSTNNSNVVKYVQYDTTNSAFEIEEDATQATNFTFTSRPLSALKEWTMLDFVAYYVTESIYSTTISSKVYVYNSRYYIQYKDKFMLIPTLSSAGLTDLFEYSSGLGKVKNNSTSQNKMNLEQMLTYDLYKNVITSEPQVTGQCVYNYATVSTILKGKLDHFTTKVSTSTSVKPFQVISFSENFDLGNYSSWTYSDFVLYYAFTNGFYGDTAQEFEITLPFTYIPKYVKNSSLYYNLSYLDIVLCKVLGDDGGSPANYNYLHSTNASYKFKLVYNDSNEFYLEYNGHYIPLSSEISIDFSKMEVISTEIGANLTETDINKKVEEFTDITHGATDYYYGDTFSGTKYDYKTYFSSKNFQTFVNANCAPAYVYYMLDQNSDTGSVTATKVINFAFERDAGKDGTYFNYDVFYEFYDSYLVNYLNTTQAYELSVDISSTDGEFSTATHDMVAKLVYDKIYPDLVFDNYYYYTIDAGKLNDLNLMSVDANTQKIIKSGSLSGTAIKQKQINLKLSSAFSSSMVATSNWSVLDYIILYERSRDDVRHNVFENMTISELTDSDYYYVVYCKDIDVDDDIDKDDDIYLYINNNFYNLRGFVSLGADGKFIGNVKFESDKNPATAGNINSFDFKVLYESYNLSINPAYKGSVEYTRNKDNISFSDGTQINFKYIDTNYADTYFRINVSLFGKYSVKALIKKTSWVEKLMTDMQVYYPDLNWGVLLATDGWIDTLGEFTSANINGLFTGGQNSANTTAPGLVLSEFFMSVATETSGGYADYEYSSVFDEDTIQALMLSLMGEENYQALVFEVEVFMDYFNSCFAPIIDDFAEEFGEDINDNSLRLNAYKSYLATLLLSSDIGEYLYTVATRVYAEYTIGEYLASAAGDYVGYYSYVNKLKDEDGNTVDAYSYGTIYELIRYENQYCGGSNPTFTFNFKKAFEKYQNSNYKVMGYSLEEALADENVYEVVAKYLLLRIDADYSTIYNKGYDVNENGKVVDSNGYEVEGESSETYIYFYMLHVYWEIATEVNILNQPSYLKIYREYLNGSLYRWDIVKTENIETADQYFEYYDTEQAKLTIYKFTTLLNSARLFIPIITFNDQTNGSILDILKELIETINDFGESFTDPSKIADNISIPIANAYSILAHDSSLKKDVQFVFNNTLSLYFTMCFSENSAFEIGDIFKEIINSVLPIDLSSESCWEKILKYHESLGNIIDEIKLVRELLPGEKTDRGSSRQIGATDAYYTDMQLDIIINAYVDLKSNLDQYITAQKRIDQAQKRSITFTLAQYGANYVSSGYEFSVRNKSYTFKPETDPVRLAEYVYGGVFLESVGEGAQYTHPEFTGIVKASKVYDSEDKLLKTNLDTWSELRGFLSKIADQTAELYYMTNLADLDVSKNNAIKLRDPISVNIYGSIEEALYCFIIDGIEDEIVARITNSYKQDGSYDTISIKTYTHEKFVAMAQYIFSGEVTEKQLEEMTLEEFKRLAMKQVMANEQNQSESPEERADKYMMVFNLLGVQVDLQGGSAGTIDRVLYNSQVLKSDTKVEYLVDGISQGNITGKFRVSSNTLEMIKVLSGLENRPDREILTRQYAGIRSGDYYDEAFGDIFIACTYQDGLYYPILGSASKNPDSSLYADYMNAGFIKHQFTSDYYDNDSNVVVMKGVITADGYPTAIRKYNNPIEVLQKGLFSSNSKTYNEVTYYRTNIGTNFGEGEDLVDASKAVGRITTKNYTRYIQGTSFTNGIGATTTYTGRSNLRTIVSSDYTANFVQSRSEYLMGQADEFGAISVLDDFSYFYLFGGQSWTLLMLAFITIIPVMVNALGGAASRILDILVLFISSPLIISTNSLYPDGKNSIYKKWKKNIESVAMSAFGYIIAFSSFTLLIPMIYNIDTFINYETFEAIVGIGGLGGFISYPMINGLLRCLWVITAVSVLERLPAILLPIISANRGDLSSPHPGLGSGAGKKFTDKAQNVVKSAKELGTILSGKAAMGALASLKDEALNMIPGYDAIKSAKEKYLDPKLDKAHQDKVKAEEKLIEEGLKLYGVDAKTAKAAAKAVAAADNAQKKAKDDEKKRMEQYKKEFQSLTETKA